MVFDSFLKDLQKLGQPQGTISVERQNFAVPSHPDLVTLCADPPVYEIPNFLSAEECRAVVDAANGGKAMPPIPYGGTNRIFTGVKWAADRAEASEPFFERACAIFGDVPPSRFEPVTVTRYGVGQYQAKHLDARLPHEVRRTPPYFAAGGQRIAQIIVYLQAPERGGTTKFYGSAFDGLAAVPEVGKALVFPTATLRGEADERYLHSGEPVEAGTKYISTRARGRASRARIRRAWESRADAGARWLDARAQWARGSWRRSGRTRRTSTRR